MIVTATLMDSPKLPVFLLILAFVFGAFCVNFSWVHDYHNSDSFLLAFISREVYTPYYWGDNRYGMPVPWLASWISDYRYNLLFQTQIMILAAFANAVVFQGWFLHRCTGLTAPNLSVAALSLIGCILVLRPTHQTAHVLALAHPYLISLLPLLVGVALLFRSRRGPLFLRSAIAGICFALSFWINLSHVALALGLVVLLPVLDCTYRRSLTLRLLSCSLVFAAGAGVFWHASRYPRLAELKIAPISTIPNAVYLLTSNTFTWFLHPVGMSVLVVLLLLAMAVQHRRKTFALHYRVADAAVFLALAVTFALAMAALDWVAMNNHEARYWTTSMILILLVMTGWLASALFRWLEKATGSPSLASTSCALLLLAVVVNAFGASSPAAALGRIDRVTGARVQSIRALGCTHLVGSYWDTWISVFHQRSHGYLPTLWAITSRSEVAERLWASFPPEDRRYCQVCGDPMTEYFRIHFRLPPLRPSSQHGTICRLEPVPASSSTAQAN